MLSYTEFEDLIIDIVDKMLNLNVSPVNEGKDGGLDGYTCKKEKLIVVQAKRYKEKKDLMKQLEKEKEKMDKIVDEKIKYILFTSAKLQYNDKKLIKNIMAPYVTSINDIHGFSDINKYIHKYPEIEKNHYKLWFASTTILERIFHNSIFEKTEILNLKLKEKLKIYVQNSSFSEALEILEKENTIIISGLPGVGKTTLGQMLISYYVKKNYDFINIDKIDDYFSIPKSNKKTVFFFDDFLGDIKYSLSLEKEAKNIIDVINIINRSKNLKLIITTREMVLKNAKEESESFKNCDLDFLKIILELRDYTLKQKLKIFINHMEYYNVPRKKLKQIVEDDGIVKIVKHPHYFPRIIEHISIYNSKVDDKDYASFILENLNDSSRIWDFIIAGKLSENYQQFLKLMFFANEIWGVWYDECEILFHSLVSKADNFKTIAKELESLNLIKIDSRRAIDFFDPSIKDYLSNIIKNDTLNLEKSINNCKHADLLQVMIKFYIYECKVSKNEIDEMLHYTVNRVKDYLKINSNDIDCISSLYKQSAVLNLVRLLDSDNMLKIKDDLVEALLSKRVESNFQIFEILKNMKDNGAIFAEEDLKNILIFIGEELSDIYYDNMIDYFEDIEENGVKDIFLKRILENLENIEDYSFENRDEAVEKIDRLENINQYFECKEIEKVIKNIEHELTFYNMSSDDYENDKKEAFELKDEKDITDEEINEMFNAYVNSRDVLNEN
jgi:hypothetical protein